LAAASLTVSAAIGTTAGVIGVAHADDTQPTSIELLNECNKSTDSCVFHPNGNPTVFAGDVHQIGTTLFNCGPESAVKRVSWFDETGETNSVGISFIFANEQALGPLAAFKSEFEITYGHKWGTSESTGRTTNIKVEAREKGWLVRSSPMQRISGTYELHFGSRFHGHYYWYVPFEITGPAPDATNIEVVSQRSDPMTEGELRQCA
jgi:hypothetical protein